MSDEGGAHDLAETVVSPTPVADIWSGITLFETDHGARSGAVTAGRDYWPRTGVCWRYLVRDHGGLGYLGLDQRQLRTLMPRSMYWEWTCLVAT